MPDFNQEAKMMAYDMKRPPAGPATFTTTDRIERSSRRTTWLSQREVQDLRDLWTGVSLSTGMRSSHGALENRLLLAPPRDVGAPLLDELGRCGGWVSEGRLLRVVVAEGWGVWNELRRELHRLVRAGKVERRAVPMPNIPMPTSTLDTRMGELTSERTATEQQQMNDWNGFEFRLAGARLALKIVPLKREERWKRADEELEREWRIVHGSETRRSGAYEPPDDARRSGANRAYSALAKMSERHAEILRIVFGRHHESDASAVEAVRGLVGGDEARARDQIEAACAAYREARGS